MENAGGGVEFSNDLHIIPYAKSAFQQPLECPVGVPAGSLLRFHHTVKLDLEAGNYNVTFGLASLPQEKYEKYRKGLLRERLIFQECSRMRDALRITVDMEESGNPPFFGIANLPDSTTAEMIPAASHEIHAVSSPKVREDRPTILHLTHWKAGSQWIRKILTQCAGGRIVEPEAGEAQVRFHPMQSGGVYPAVYLTREELSRVTLPNDTRKFVVIRDLRDTLVSAYFSFRASHPILTPHNHETRAALSGLDVETGMTYLMGEFLTGCAAIQLSWLESEEQVIRYEDLLQGDEDVLTDVLLRKCGLPVSEEVVRAAIVANRFENLSGRPRGQEDRGSHERKGIAGDWRNHFTPRVKQAFKARFGGLLVAAGYETGLDW